MNMELNKIACFGVAGNFTGHLEQAGEAADFVNVQAAAGAPKALFPTFLPENNAGNNICVNQNISVDSATPDFLHIFPFDSSKIIFPENEEKLQIEPECAIICEVKWEQSKSETNQLVQNDKKVADLKPVLFGASNDCSIRKEGAKKISLKKNWGSCSKGLSDNLLVLDDFSPSGNINNYRIASFLVRGSQCFSYGEDSAVRDYSYIYNQLLCWIIDKLNNQKNEGPAEKIHDYLLESGCPSKIMISIGATRYTDFGKNNFLCKGDYSVVILYPEGKYSNKDIQKIALLEKSDYSKYEDISVLKQKIC